MSFTLNNLGSPKSNVSNATVAAVSTNSPLKSNLNIEDIVKKSEDKSYLNSEGTASGSTFESSNSPLFVFGCQKKNSDTKTTEGFNFIFDSNSIDTCIDSSSKSNTGSTVTRSKSFKFSTENNLFTTKKNMESKLEDKTKAELDSDNNNENSNKNFIKDEELNTQEQKQNKDSNEEMIVMKVLVTEFKNVVESFVKERIESDTKIAALEGRVKTLEEEMQNLKNVDLKESLTNSVAKTNNTAMSMANTAQKIEQSPTDVSCQTPSPLIPLLTESSAHKKNVFGSRNSLFCASTVPLFNSASSNSFGSVANSLLGNGNSTSPNLVLENSIVSPTKSTQAYVGSQLFGTNMQTYNQNGKNFVPEQKVRKPQKLFSHEAVTNYLNAHTESGVINHLSNVSTTSHLKKTTNRQENLEQHQNMSTKEAFESHIQRTIEMTIKKAFEEYLEAAKFNSSESHLEKFKNPFTL